MKRIICLLLVLSLVFAFSISVFADDEDEEVLLDIKGITFTPAVEGEAVESVRGGAADNKELSFDTAFIKYCHNGWNDITLDFKRNIGDSGFDPAVINWFRFYETAGGGNAADMLKDVYVYAE